MGVMVGVVKQVIVVTTSNTGNVRDSCYDYNKIICNNSAIFHKVSGLGSLLVQGASAPQL